MIHQLDLLNYYFLWAHLHQQIGADLYSMLHFEEGELIVVFSLMVQSEDDTLRRLLVTEYADLVVNPEGLQRALNIASQFV